MNKNKINMTVGDVVINLGMYLHESNNMLNLHNDKNLYVGQL